jgi:hypothetical protein
MADHDEIDNENDEIESEGEGDEETPGEEYMSPEEEFRQLYANSDTIAEELKSIAMRMQQQNERVGAEVLRQVAGQVMEFVGELIAATGSFLEEHDARISELEQGESGGGLALEEAKVIYRALYANNKLWADVKSQATSEQREVIELQMTMNDDAMKLLAELTDDELPQMIEEEVKKVKDGSRLSS